MYCQYEYPKQKFCCGPCQVLLMQPKSVRKYAVRPGSDLAAQSRDMSWSEPGDAMSFITCLGHDMTIFVLYRKTMQNSLTRFWPRMRSSARPGPRLSSWDSEKWRCKNPFVGPGPGLAWRFRFSQGLPCVNQV